MLFNNDIFTDFDDITIFPELLPIDPPNLCPTSTEITSLSSWLEKLTSDVYTQSLRVMIERAKRQKLETIIRKLKRDLISPKHLSPATK